MPASRGSSSTIPRARRQQPAALSALLILFGFRLVPTPQSLQIRFSNPCPFRYLSPQHLFTRNGALYKIGTASRKIACKILIQKVWLPGMGSNHELVHRFLKSRNFLILQSR